MDVCSRKALLQHHQAEQLVSLAAFRRPATIWAASPRERNTSAAQKYEKRASRSVVEGTGRADGAALRRGQVLDVVCDSIAFGGDGVCRVTQDEDGAASALSYVIFCRGALPGERLTACVTAIRRGHATAAKLRTLQPSPDAADPQCQHYGPCGGCALQHLSYAAQLRVKQSQVTELLQRVGGLDLSSAVILPILACPQPYAFRNKMEFSFSPRSWQPGAGANGVADDHVVQRFALGLHQPGRHDQVLPIASCSIQDDTANRILQLVSLRSQTLGLEPYDERSRRGLLMHLAIRRGSEAGVPEYMVHLTTAVQDQKRLQPLVLAIVEAFPEVISIINTIAPKPGKEGGSRDGRSIVLHGRGQISEMLCGLRFEISANSFFQTNTQQAEALYKAVKAAAGLAQDGSDVIYDLYCGTGSIGLTLAAHCKAVYGYEVSAAAVANARRNAELNQITNAHFFQADLHQTVPDAAVPAADVVITDPGRTGMAGGLVQFLRRSGSRRVVYVSCNPATQARDIALLCASDREDKQDHTFWVVQVQACDMFPHSHHVESLVVLDRQSCVLLEC